MSYILNPLLQKFMKPDKKEKLEGNSNSKMNENDSAEVPKQISELPKPDADKQTSNSQPKRKEKSKPKKTKKVMHDYSELAPPINEAPPPTLDFNYLKPVNVSINENYKVSPEWEQNLISWFARLRPMMWPLETEPTSNFQPVLDLIESQNMPQTNMVSNLNEPEKIIFYFAQNTNRFTKCDLAWIFSSLIFTDRLLNHEMIQCLTYILTKMVEQINELPTVEDPLYPYLMTVVTIIQKFFHAA